jgi:hypothetical protein
VTVSNQLFLEAQNQRDQSVTPIVADGEDAAKEIQIGKPCGILHELVLGARNCQRLAVVMKHRRELPGIGIPGWPAECGTEIRSARGPERPPAIVF